MEQHNCVCLCVSYTILAMSWTECDHFVFIVYRLRETLIDDPVLESHTARSLQDFRSFQTNLNTAQDQTASHFFSLSCEKDGN